MAIRATVDLITKETLQNGLTAGGSLRLVFNDTGTVQLVKKIDNDYQIIWQSADLDPNAVAGLDPNTGTLLASEVPADVVVLDPNTGKVPVGQLPPMSGGGDTWTQPALSPLTLTAGQEYTLTHPAVTNEEFDLLVKRNTGVTGQTNVSLDFDQLDASLFTQQDNTKTTFLGGVVELKDPGGGATAPIGSGAGRTGLYIPLVNSLAPTTGLYTGDTGYSITAVGSAAYGDSVNGATAWAGNSSRSIQVGSGQSLFQLGTGDFTIEFWFKDPDASSTMGIIGARTGSGDQPALVAQANGFNFFNGSSQIFNARATGWHHFSFVRTSGNVQCYRDGTAVGSPVAVGSFSAVVANPRIGDADIAGSFPLITGAYIQQFVIVKGWAGRSGNFTPPNYLYTPTYPTTDYWWVATTDLSHFTWTGVSLLNSVTVAGAQPAGTNRKWLISFDGRVTWNKWDGAAWQPHAGGLADIANGNTTAEMQTGLTNRVPGVGEVGLDFAVGLQTTDALATPTVDGITINYDEPTRYDPATVGNYGSSTEFGIKRIDATTTKVKNQMGTTQKVFIQMVQPATP